MCRSGWRETGSLPLVCRTSVQSKRRSAASLALPLATRARVTNLQNGRSVDVVVNDRGPYAGNRVMDLSEKAAVALGMTQSGLAQVVIRAQIGPIRIRG